MSDSDDLDLEDLAAEILSDGELPKDSFSNDFVHDEPIEKEQTPQAPEPAKRIKTMEVSHLPHGEVRGKIAQFLPIILGAGVMYWGLFSVCVGAIIRIFAEHETAVFWGMIGGLGVFIGFGIMIDGYLKRTFKKYILKLDETSITVHGTSGWRFLKKTIELDEIEKIIFGQKLSAFFTVADAASKFKLASGSAVDMAKDQNMNRLFFETKDGKRCHIEYFSYAFEEASLARFANELAERNIKIEYANTME